MKLSTKLFLLSIVVVLLVMGVAGHLFVSGAKKYQLNELSNRMRLDAQVASDRIVERDKYTQLVAESISRNRSIKKALVLLESRGINQVLNEYVAVYPFIEYLLIVDDVGDVFAANTRDGKGNKLDGEVFLSESIIAHPFYNSNTALTKSSVVGKDPYFQMIGLEDKFAQHYATPIRQKGNVIGEIILAVDWEKTHQEILELLVGELQMTGHPIEAISVYNKDDVLLSSVDHLYLKDDVYRKKHQHIGETLVIEMPVQLGSATGRVEVKYDRRKALIPIETIERAIVLGVAAVGLVLGLVMLVIMRITVFSRVEKLQLQMEKISSGNWGERVPSDGKDELSALGTSFNSMLDNLLAKSTSVENLNDTVAELKDTESRLEDALAELDMQKFAFDQHAIVGITDIQGTITYVNDLFCKISGYEREELLGNNHRILKSGRHGEEFFRNMYLAISKGRVWHGEICNRNKGGEEYWVDTTIVPFVGEDGIVSKYVAIRTDVTLIKQAEQSMERAKVAAEDAAKAKSEFLASMSHEIRTPMNGVLGMLGILEKGKLASEQRRHLSLAKSSAKSLLSVINDILDFSKIESGKLQVEYIDFNLRQLIDEFAETMAFRSKEKGIELIVDSRDVNESIVMGDPGRIRQILNNLVGNALKFTSEGEVVIKAGLEDAGEIGLLFFCSIKDTGIGISEGNQKRLFESFTQADSSTTRKYGGTGLGLTITKRLCELMGGSISVFSELGKGSRFDFSVLLQKSENSIAVLPKVDISKLSILVVDDNSTNREVLTTQLAMWGATTADAINGVAALEAVCDRKKRGKPPFDLILLDMNMPQMDGEEVGKSIREDKSLDQTKLIMMTSTGVPGDVKRLQKLGFQAYFSKPVSTEDLERGLAVVAANDSTSATDMVTTYSAKDMFKVESEIPIISEILRDKHLLLVEDNPVNQEVARGMLEDLGIKVDIANNGQEALNCLQEKERAARYACVLMDCQMPTMDGYTATRELRNGAAGEHAASIPIIAMTANAMKGDREKCIASGMNDYISKPVEPDELQSVLEKWVGDQRIAEVVNSPVEQIKSDLQIWDMEAALKRCRQKEDRLIIILESCLKTIPELLDGLKGHIGSEQRSEAQLEAHSIKGVSGNVGGERLQQAAGELEMALRHNADKAELIDACDKVFAQWVELQGPLKLYIQDKGA